MSAERLLPTGFGIMRNDLSEIRTELCVHMLDRGHSDLAMTLLASAAQAMATIDAEAERFAGYFGMPGLGVPALLL